MLGTGVLDAVAVQDQGSDQDGRAVLVVDLRGPMGWRGTGLVTRCGVGLRGAVYDVEPELGGTSDHACGLARVLYAGELDDDAAFS